jgi:hypothetical protein
MKVALFTDSRVNAGGGFQVTLSAAKTLNKLNISGINIDLVVTQKDVYKKIFPLCNKKVLIFNENSILNRAGLFLYKNNFFKKIYHKFSLNNPLEIFFKKNKYDLIFFINPSRLVLFCVKTNFIYTIWEFAHKDHPALPEYTENTIRNRELCYNYACDKAFKIILFNKRSKKDFSKYYPVNDSRIECFFFGPHIIDQKIIINSNIDEKIKNKKFIFYPAQFWPHKNHIYLLNALKKYNLKHSNKINLVFTGHDKGNLSLIKENIKNLKISDYVILFDYLKDSDLQYLYKKSFAVIFPSLIGSQSLPLFESFFFEKPIMYNQKIIDPIYNKAILKLDVTDCDSFILNMKRLLKNKNFVKNLIKQGKKIYNFNLDTKHVKNKLKNILLEYDDFQKKWNN